MKIKHLLPVFITAIILISLDVFSATYYSRQNGNWNTNATWSTTSHTGGAAGAFPIAGDIVFIGAHTITVTTNGACNSITFDVSGGTLSVNTGQTLTVTGAIALNNAANANTAANIEGLGTIDCGSINLGNGTSATNNNTTRTHIITSTISSMNVSGNITINSYFANNNRIRNGGFTLTSGTLEIEGSIVTINSNGNNTSTFTLGNSSPILNLGGVTPFTISGTGTSTITLNGAGATVNYNRGGDQSVRSATYTNLTTSNSGTKTLSGNTTIRNLAIQGSTTLATNTFNITGNADGTMTMDAGTFLALGNAGSVTAVIFPSNFTNVNISLDNTSTVIYQSNGNQTVSGVPTYGNLILTTGGIKTLASSISIDGDLSIDGSAVLDVSASSYAINLSGNWSNTSSAGNPFVERSGTVSFIGSTPQNISAETFYMLLLNNSIGFNGTGNINVTNNLTMTAGNIDMGANTLALTPTNSASLAYITGSVIGKFQRGVPASSASEYIFPVGTSSTTNSAKVIRTSGTGTGTITVEYIPGDPGSAGLPLLDGATEVSSIFTDGYWELSTSLGASTFTLDLDGTGMTSYTIRPRTRILNRTGSLADWAAAGTHAAGTPPVVSRTGLATAALSGQYGLANVDARIWYVFQDGNWADASTWTLDASTAPIFNNPGNEIPGNNDQVIIRSGRSVTVQPATNNISISSIEVKGNLYLTSSTGHDFQVINGDGIINIEGNGGVENFPAGDTDGAVGFSDPDNGGTLVVDGNGNLSLNVARTFKNVIFDRDNNTDVAILAANYSILGDFTVRNGRFQFGDGTTTARSLTVERNVLVENDGSTRIGSIITANANTTHTFVMNGNFTNNGEAYFTNRTDFASTADRYNPGNSYYTTTDPSRVEVSFTSGTQDQVVNCNNLTYFSRIVINKGVDATYTLFLQTTDSANFRLLGSANQNINADVTLPSENNNAFALIKGTVKLDNNIIIPVLNRVTNYAIPSAARLWIDGGYVRKTVGTAIVPYGKIEISEGTLIADVNSGITTRENGSVKIDGGFVRLNQFRTSVDGISAQGTYEQNGGEVLITAPGTNINQEYAQFSLTYSGTAFIMTGGTLTIRGRTGVHSSGLRGSVFINSDPGNQQVTGGTVLFESNTATEYRVTSRAPFYNVIMRAGIAGAGNIVLTGTTSGPGAGITLDAQPLVVLNDLIIEGHETDPLLNDIKFYATTSDTNVNDVYIGGSLRIEEGGQYIACFPDWTTGTENNYNGLANLPSHVNTTYFNQTIGTNMIESIYWGNNNYFDYDIVVGASNNENMIELGRMVLNRNSGNELRLEAPGPGSGNRGNNSLTMDVNGDLEVLSGTLDQGRLTIRLWGNAVNYDRLGTWFVGGTYPVSGGTPSEAQIRFREDDDLTITTSDNAIFGNTRLNISINRPLELFSDVYFERVQFWRGILYIGTHQLTIDEMWDLNNDNDTDNGFFSQGAGTSSILRLADAGRYAGGGGNNQEIMVITSGKASDGGLRLKIFDNTTSILGDSVRNNRETITFPVGFNLNFDVATWTTNTRYRPAQLKVTGFSDDGYVTVRPVSGVLQTTVLTGGEVLQHYWRISHSDFTALPTTAWRFYYRNRNESGIADLPGVASDENLYVPGKVQDGGAYTRNYESDSQSEQDVDGVYPGPADANTRVIVFNGDNTGTTDDDLFGFSANAPGFTLENANYTAGVPGRFVGAPTIYYSRLSNNSDWYNRNWTDGNHWSLVPHDGATDNNARPAAGTWPMTGDVAVIGYGGFTGGISPRHSLMINNANIITVAEVIFNNPINDGSRLVVNQNGTLTFGKIGGTGGTFMERPNSPAEAATITGDFGEFYSNNNFTYNYFLNGNGTYNITPATTVFPNLRVEGGNSSRIAIFQDDIIVNNNMTVDGNTIVRTSNGIIGDIIVREDLRIGGYLGGTFQFNDGTERRVEVGRLWLRNDGNCNISVLNGIENSLRHQFIVNSDILQERPGFINLYGGTAANANHVILQLSGEGDHSYTKTDGSIANFFQIVMNKGNNASNSFTISEPFTVPEANSTFQPLEILNGTLVLDESSVDILLANGSNFYLPNTTNPMASSGSGGLEIRQGTVRIEGNNTGIILDGKLTISGGTLNMATGVGNGNNFIEYTASGSAEMDVTDGVLTVGSHIRRSTTSTSGVLKYSQTGGQVTIGRMAAPTTSRGLFEVLNTGSSFTLDIDPLAGHAFTIVRHVNSTTVPTLRLSPQTVSISDNSVITIGSGDTPGNQNNFGIYAEAPLTKLSIASGNITGAKLYSVPLDVNELSITNGATFNANGFNVTINEALANNGSYTTSGTSGNNQNTIFPSNAASTVSGSGTTNFWNFTKQGSGTLTLAKEVTVNNNGFIYSGTLNTGSFAMNLKKDLLHDATHTSDPAGPGIIFNGTQKQNLDRSGSGTSIFSVVELNNASGLVIADNDENFQFDSKLILNTGVLDIGGNLIIFPVGARIENKAGGTSVNDFNINRMIQTNSSIRDFGVRKFYPATTGGNISFTYPVGLLAYTPVVMNITDVSAGQITVRPVADIPPIAEDDETTGTCSDPDIVDSENVLRYYWIVKSENISGLNGSAEMYYDANDIRVTAPYTVDNYGPARLFNQSDTWDKVFTNSDFDEISQRITFPFNNSNNATLEGIYTAGVTLQNDGTTLLCGAAIPDQVPQFITLEQVASGDVYVDGSYQGGIAPNAGTSFDLVVKPGFTLMYDVNNIRTRKITIEAGATLEIGSGTSNHNLGFVTGEGNLKLTSNASFVLFPTGDYDSFFPDANCTMGGGLEYAGTGSYAVLAGLPRIRNVVFSGSGSRTFPNNHDLIVCEDLEVLGSVTLTVPDGNNSTTVLGNIYKSDASNFINGGGNSTIALNGSVQQFIRGDFTNNDRFNNLTVNNPAGLSVINATDEVRSISANADVDVNGQLTFVSGLIRTDNNNSLRLRQSGSLAGYNSSRYVNGPFVRELPNNTQVYPYPVGDGGRYGYMTIEDPNGGVSPKFWTVRYYNGVPTSYPTVDNLTPNPISGIESVSGNEYWVIDDGSVSGGGEQATIGLSWDGSSDISPDPADWPDITVMAWNDPAGYWDTKGGTSHIGTAGFGTFKSNEKLSFSENIVTLGSTSLNNPLPVELVSFTGREQDGQVLLNWRTASEQNNDYFQIEHSLDARTFISIGEVAGSGTISTTQNYSFIHRSPAYPNNYYRLKQVDFDGAFEYSDVILVRMNGVFERQPLDFVMYPNPTTGNSVNITFSNIDFSQPLTIEMVSLNGRLLYQQVVDPAGLSDEISLDFGYTLSKGIYIVRLLQSGNSSIKKLVLK